MNVIVVPPAADEFEAAARHYEQKQIGLGKRFRDEVHRNIQWITRNPNVPRERPGGYRRVNLTIFPYYIAYMQMGETAWILAVAHSHREPDYWIERKLRIGRPSDLP